MKKNFSSPLGGGLVRKQNSADLGYFNTFSSPLGDGVVHPCKVAWVGDYSFSSPSGDGLVRVILIE